MFHYYLSQFLIDGELTQYDGILLLVGLGVFAVYTFKDAMKQREKNSEEEPTPVKKISI